MKEANSRRVCTFWFLRILGAVYFIAFYSLYTQVEGLAGPKGILPINDYLNAITTNLQGNDRWLKVPTLSWLSPSDGALGLICITGMIAALGMMLNLMPFIWTIVCWVTYLSLLHSVRVFLSFQWDILLLEAGFLAIFIAPWHIKFKVPSQEPEAPGWTTWLGRLLLFKLMFSSGLVKWISGDESWRDFTALTYHFQTQPIPNPLSWYAHHLDRWILEAAVAMTFLVEIVVPFFYFWPRRARLWAGMLTFGLMAGISISGNYTFFNLLTMTLCLFLIDDRHLKSLRLVKIPEEVPQKANVLRRWVLAFPVIALLVGLNLFVAKATVERYSQGRITMPDFYNEVCARLDPYRASLQPFLLANGYGLFANMTLTRPEIVIEGSEDGKTWVEYEFHHKPVKLDKRPDQIAPLQPRLDWQMWFAALRGNINHVPWFKGLIMRVLQNEPEVMALFKHNPFAEKAPKFVRAVLYEYEFTKPHERQKSGHWWKRKFLGLFCPPVHLKS